MTISPTYFDKHRGFAMGTILSGSGVGGLVIAPVLRVLIDRYGVQWALRILGIWNFTVGVPVCLVARHRYKRGTATRNGKTRLNMNLAKRGTFLYQVSWSIILTAPVS